MKKRLISVILSVMMIVALLPSFSAVAAFSISASAVSYEMLSKEARNCISKDLTLPENITWKSSNPSVISNDGKVNRTEKTEEVTLTASAGGTSKDFKFTVMPDKCYVNYSDSFAYSDKVNMLFTTSLSEWKTKWGNATANTHKFAVETLSDSSTNCYIKNDMWIDRPYYTISGIKPTGKFTVSYMVYMDIADNLAGMYDYDFIFGGTKLFTRFVFNADNTVGEVRYYGGTAAGEHIGAAAFNNMNLRRRWVKMDWKFDTVNQKMWLYIDGTLVTKTDGLSSPSMTPSLDRVDFSLGQNVEGVALGIDDMSIVTEYEDTGDVSISYEMLSRESRNCVSQNLTLPTTLDGEEITWLSSNTSVIDMDGTVIRPETAPQNVTVFALIGNKVKSFDFTVMPKTYYVNYSESFDYGDKEGAVITTYLHDWKTRWKNTHHYSSKFTNETLSDSSTNCYIKNEMWKDRPQYVTGEMKPEGRFTVSHMTYLDIADNTEGMYDFEFNFGGEENILMRFWFKDDNTVGEVRYYGGVENGERVGDEEFNALNLKRRWVKFDWEFDTSAQKMWLYIDGQLVTKAEGLDSSRMTGALKRIDFNIGLNTMMLVLGIDDMSIVTKYDTIDDKEIADVYRLLSYESFSEQSKFAITEDLDLSRAVPEGYENTIVTFESGSPNLTISGNTGKIQRAEEDAEAILYAKISDYDTDFTMTKTFKFNVKGMNYNVYTTSSFYYPDLTGQRADAAYGGWKLGSIPPQEGCLDSCYVKETGNYCVKAFRTASATSLGITDANSFRYNIATSPRRDITFETRMKVGKPTDKTQVYIINLYGTYEGVAGSKELVPMHIYADETATSLRISYYDELTNSNVQTPIAIDFAFPDEWFDLKMEVNLFDKTVNIFVNGECVTPSPLNFAKAEGVDINKKIASITAFTANPFRQEKNAELYLDDFTAYCVQTASSDVALYKNGKKVTDIGYLTAGDTVSAEVQLYNSEDSMEFESANVIAAIYDGQKLHNVTIVKKTVQDGAINVTFPALDIPETIVNARIKIFFVSATGGISPLREEHVVPHKLNGTIVPKKYTDSGTGRTYYTIDLNGEDAIRSYYSMITWEKDADRFYFYDNQERLYVYDISTNQYRYIDTLFNQYLVSISKKGNVFYIKDTGEIIRMNPVTQKKEVVGTLPKDMNIGAAMLIQVNDDESYLSLEIVENSSTEFDVTRKTRIPVMDINTGEWDLRYIFGFDTKVYAPDHMNLNPNPLYSNLVAFAHEGTGDEGQGNPERIWLLNRDTGEYKNLFKQKMTTDILPAETVGHEDWMKSGEQMVFANLATGTPGGITLFNKDGSNRRYVNNDYSYNHASGSPVTDRFVVSDTSYPGRTTELVLIDCYTGKSYHLATLPQNGKDPGHTHPSFSMDGNKVIFGLYSEDLSTIRIGWMDISDIISSAEDGKDIVLSSSCSTSSYGGTDFYLAEKDRNGQTFYSIADGNHMNVNITEFEEETANVTITFDYIDKGTDDILIDYIKWENVKGKNRIVEYEERIARKNTGSVKTAEVTITGMNAENLKMLGTDFTVKGDGSELEIANVSVRK